MKTISKRNYWKYLFWLGPVLVIMGITAGLVSGQWGSIPLVLIIGGIVVTLLYLLFQAERNSWWSRRSTQAGTNALIATLAVFVILGLVNFLAVRYPVRVDLTETGLYTLAPQSRQLVRSLQKPVKLWIFDRNQNAEDRALLENYRRQGQNFSFEYIDPQLQLGLANKFNVQKPGEVYLESGQQRRLLQTVNEQERLSETRLTNALQQITTNFKAKVYFLQGHGEYPVAGESPLTQALGVLADKSYTLEPLNLAQQPTVPQDANVVVIAGARRSLLAPEVKGLTAYLNRGGSLLLAVDPTINLGIDSLLKSWGVTLDNRLAVNPAGTALGYGPAEILVDNYGQHPITQDFGNGIAILQAARPIEITPVNGIQATPLLITSPQSWAEADLKSENLQFDPKSDRNGPLTLGVALTKRNPTEARLVVIGSSNFITNEQFQQQLNGDLFTNSVSWLSKQDAPAQLSIRPKEAKNRRINLQAAQANVLGLAALGLVPLIGFAAAAILWWQRR